ncbi:hypothetical protein [Ilumatobacter sp.]|uniref:hypothetical protein n=1 Tax=Ilumatobacter sp. TaxID=1967498 RepID=UPI003B5292F1
MPAETVRTTRPSDDTAERGSPVDPGSVGPGEDGGRRRPPRRRPSNIGPSRPRRRQHGSDPSIDRCELERSGWRTTLEFRENAVRARSGRLEHVIEIWRAEAERVEADGSTSFAAAEAMSAAAAWSRLRTEADLSGLGRRRGGRRTRTTDPLDRPGAPS